MNESAVIPGDAGIDSDRQLLARVMAGELDAYEGIMRRYNQSLFRLARSIVNVDAEAMDIIQESYITAFERLDELQNPDALKSWLAKIVRNTALMHLRKNRRYLQMDEPGFEKIMNLSRPVDHQEQPDRQLANAQLRKVLENCIDELPDAFRSVFMLRAVEHCSISTVAEILDLKEATVKTRFHRARMLLQKRLLEYGDTGGIELHEFAGERCDTIVRNVIRQLEHRGAAGRAGRPDISNSIPGR
jgi:RNA polymerase sigma-70 factor, ECF subfamily